MAGVKAILAILGDKTASPKLSTLDYRYRPFTAELSTPKGVAVLEEDRWEEEAEEKEGKGEGEEERHFVSKDEKKDGFLNECRTVPRSTRLPCRTRVP